MMYAGALDAAWWAALGAATRWAPDYTGISHSETYTPAVSAGSANWLMIGISLGTDTVFFQAPFLTAESDGGEQTSDNGFDTGFFWITADAGPDRHAVQVAIPGMPNAIGIGTGVMSQCVALEPYLNNGEIRPMSSDTPLNSAYYKTGFLLDVGSNGSLPYSDTVSFFKCPARGSTAAVNHYSPFAWAGTPAAVIAAIMLQMGQDAGYVDTAAFADAHIALANDTVGDIPIGGPAGPEIAWESVVYCSRKVGQKVIDLLIEIMRHTRDMYFTREDGTISVKSFTDSTADVSSLTLSDGVLAVEWSLDSALVFNTVSASWGSGYRQWGVPSDVPSATGFAVQEDPELDSFQDTKYVHEVSDAASVAKYGELRLKGRERQTAASGGRKVETAHYPFFLGPGCASSWWETYGYGGMMHVTNWLKSDSQERRIVTVRQDMRALDWGIGSRATGIAVTDDAQTIAEAFCIERTYDFDRLTVDSVLLERPSNV